MHGAADADRRTVVIHGLFRLRQWSIKSPGLLRLLVLLRPVYPCALAVLPFVSRQSPRVFLDGLLAVVGAR